MFFRCKWITFFFKKKKQLTMEWSRHGYPEDKPWLKDAFARFAVKPRYSSHASHGRRVAADPEPTEPMMLMDPAMILEDLAVPSNARGVDELQLHRELAELIGRTHDSSVAVDPELLSSSGVGAGETARCGDLIVPTLMEEERRRPMGMMRMMGMDVDVPVDPSLER